MSNLKILLLTSIGLLALCSCTRPGYSIDDGSYNSGLYYVDMNEHETYIARAKMTGNLKVMIPARVIAYVIVGRRLIAARQPLVSWMCADKGISSELRNVVEYWWIDLESAAIGGPLSFDDIIHLLSIENELGSIDKIRPEFIKQRMLEMKLSNCPEPREKLDLYN